MPYSLMGQLNIAKLSILPQLIYRHNIEKTAKQFWENQKHNYQASDNWEKGL